VSIFSADASRAAVAALKASFGVYFVRKKTFMSIGKMKEVA
jgi:hypothetical protein